MNASPPLRSIGAKCDICLLAIKFNILYDTRAVRIINNDRLVHDGCRRKQERDYREEWKKWLARACGISDDAIDSKYEDQLDKILNNQRIYRNRQDISHREPLEVCQFLLKLVEEHGIAFIRGHPSHPVNSIGLKAEDCLKIMQVDEKTDKYQLEEKSLRDNNVPSSIRLAAESIDNFPLDIFHLIPSRSQSSFSDQHVGAFTAVNATRNSGMGMHVDAWDSLIHYFGGQKLLIFLAGGPSVGMEFLKSLDRLKRTNPKFIETIIYHAGLRWCVVEDGDTLYFPCFAPHATACGNVPNCIIGTALLTSFTINPAIEQLNRRKRKKQLNPGEKSTLRLKKTLREAVAAITSTG